MKTAELRNNIEKVLGNSIRCLLPSYWWKRIFHQVADTIDTINGVEIVESEAKLKKLDAQQGSLATVATRKEMKISECYFPTGEDDSLTDAELFAKLTPVKAIKVNFPLPDLSGKDIGCLLVSEDLKWKGLLGILDGICAAMFHNISEGTYKYWLLTAQFNVDATNNFLKEKKFYFLEYNSDVIDEENTALLDQIFTIVDSNTDVYVKGMSWERLAKAEVIKTVDSELSDTSENPVQNKAIKAYVDEQVAKSGGGSLSINELDITSPTQIQGIIAKVREGEHDIYWVGSDTQSSSCLSYHIFDDLQLFAITDDIKMYLFDLTGNRLRTDKKNRIYIPASRVETDNAQRVKKNSVIYQLIVNNIISGTDCFLYDNDTYKDHQVMECLVRTVGTSTYVDFTSIIDGNRVTFNLTETGQFEGDHAAPLVTCDSELSDTSENAVQNKVVTNALNNKADKTDIKTLNGVSLLGGGNLQLGDGQTIVYDDTAVWDRLEETEKTTKEYINNASVVFAENLISSEDSVRKELPALQDFYGRNSPHTYRFDSILGNTIVKDGVFHHSCPTKISSFNRELYDGLFERGAYDKTTGEKIESDTLYRFKNPIRVLPQTYYTLFFFYGGEVFFFDKKGMLISWEEYDSDIFTPENVYYISATFSNASVGTNLHVVKGRTSTLINHPEYCRRDVDLSFIEKYFPNGMAGTKSIYDEVYFDSGKRKFYAVSRFIVKPAWELSWNVLEANTSHIGGFWTRQEDFYTNHARHNLIITMYDYKLEVSSEDDKVYNSESYVITNSITIFDSEFSDVEAFTEHLRINKVYVCYETKNPIITEVDESPARCLLVPEDGSRLIEFKGDNDILIAMVAEGVDTYKEILKVSVLSDDVDDVYDELDTIWEEIEYLVDDIKEIDDYYADVTQELYDEIYALEQRIAALEGNQTT